MKANRTIVFHILMTAIGLLGWKISPDTANHWLDVFVTVWCIGAVLLHYAGQVESLNRPAQLPAAVNDALQTLLSHSTLSADALAQLKPALESFPQIGQLLATMLGHSTASLKASQALLPLVGKLDDLTEVIQLLAANAAPTVDPANPSSRAVPPAAVSAPAGDSAIAPAPPSPAPAQLADPAPAAPNVVAPALVAPFAAAAAAAAAAGPVPIIPA